MKNDMENRKMNSENYRRPEEQQRRPEELRRSEEYRRHDSDYRPPHRRKSRRSRRGLRLIARLVILVLVLGLGVTYYQTFGSMDYGDPMDSSDAGINSDLSRDTQNAMDKYTNIAVFGLDNRSSGDYEGGNSDTIMVASINKSTGEIRLVSVYRDTYLDIGNDTFRKANAAYAQGGAEAAVKMLNTNLDLNITKYVCVDWLAVVDAVDALGGVDIEITEEEMNQINKYKTEVDAMTGHTTPDLTEYGTIHMDGTIATTYARIRKTAGNDFLRTSRQRIVLQKMLEKAKKAGPLALFKTAGAVCDDIYTNLKPAEMMKLMLGVGKYKIASTSGFPFSLTCKTLKTTGSTVIAINLADNVSKLHEFLFDQTDYVPTGTVQNISDEAASLSGVYDGEAAINTSSYNDTTGASGTQSTIDKNQ